MSTGNRKILRKMKRNTEKDKRMAQLEKEITRLESENSKLRRDSAGYVNRLTNFDVPTTRFNVEFPSLNRGVQPVAGKRVTHKPESAAGNATPRSNVSSDGIRKKKPRNGLSKSGKKKTKNRRMVMPTHLQLIPCPQKQIVRNFVRDVPCPPMRPKKRKAVPCTTANNRRSSNGRNGNALCCQPKRLSCVKELEEQVCSTPKRASCVKKSEEAVCSTPRQATCVKQREDVCNNNNNNNNNRNGHSTCHRERTVNCCVKTCPGKPRKPYGCPRCESNRIQKLECEVYRLRKEIETMKYERREAETALQKAILRGAKALGGRYGPMIPGSIEKLLDTCSDTTSRSSFTVCAAKDMAAMHTCHRPRKKEEFNYCEGCAR